MPGHTPKPTLQPGETPDTFLRRIEQWERGAGGPTGGTGYFSIIDGHELDGTELANSNLVLGGDGFVYQPVYGEGPFAGQISGFELAPKWLQEEVLGLGGGTPGRTGPTAAELAIQRSQVQAQNLSTFISGWSILRPTSR